MKSILITGSSGYIGTRLTRLLETTPGFERILGIDIADPPRLFSRARYIKADIRHPLLQNILESNHVDTVVHLAFALPPKHNVAECHEMNVHGAMKLVHACRKTQVKKIIFLSCSTVYGAHFDSPFYVTEERQIRPIHGELSGQDKGEIENIFLQFQEKNAGIKVVIIRSAPICGSFRPSFLIPVLAAGVSPQVIGFNPLIQVIDHEDCLEVLKRFIQGENTGVYNLAADGAIPLKKMIRLSGIYSVPTSQVLLSTVTEILWNFKLTALSREQLLFFKYQNTIDNSKIKKELNFQPRFSTEESIIRLLRSKRTQNLSPRKETLQAGFLNGDQEQQ